MLTIDEYLDRANAVLGTTDRQLSIRLGSPTLVSAYRCKRSWPSPAAMRQLAQWAGVDEELALLDLDIWRADETTAPVYRKIKDRIIKLKDAAAVILIAATAITCLPRDSHAADNNQYDYYQAQYNQNYTLCDNCVGFPGSSKGPAPVTGGKPMLPTP